MKSGMSASKQIHLDERLVAFIWIYVQPFPHGVSARASQSLVCALHIRGKGRTSWHPVLPLLFCAVGGAGFGVKEFHEVQIPFSQ